MRLSSVVLPSVDPNKTFDVIVGSDGALESAEAAEPTVAPTGPPCILLPSLCHPHLHLDKPYILTSNQPAYADLSPRSGSFEEALCTTSSAKHRYTREDLYLRGSQLLATSYSQGVTAVRAFVELDHVTGTLPLEVAARLRRDFAHLIRIQICAFAQDPLFSGPHGAENLTVLSEALRTHADEIDVLGTAPYVESDTTASLRNIDWAVSTALAADLYLDFHLDYNLDAPSAHRGKELQSEKRGPLIYDVLDVLAARSWPIAASGGARRRLLRTVCLGHCTQLTQLSQGQLDALADRIKSSGLPVYLVGLPTSDIYMMDRTQRVERTGVESTGGDLDAGDRARPAATFLPHARQRGTLQVVSLARDMGLGVCLGVNNVGNAFGPFGTGDPLSLASWGVGLYHAGGEGDAEILYGCVSWEAKRAIGLLGTASGVGGWIEKGEGEGDESEEDDNRKGQGQTGKRAVGRGPENFWLLVENRKWIKVPGAAGDAEKTRREGSRQALMIPARQRLSIKDVVWDPPETELRRIIP